MKIGVLTISDRGSRGEYEDRSGPLIVSILQSRTPWQVSHQAIVPDEMAVIVDTLAAWTDEKVNLILTTGGTSRRRRPAVSLSGKRRALLKRCGPKAAKSPNTPCCPGRWPAFGGGH